MLLLFGYVVSQFFFFKFFIFIFGVVVVKIGFSQQNGVLELGSKVLVDGCFDDVVVEKDVYDV